MRMCLIIIGIFGVFDTGMRSRKPISAGEGPRDTAAIVTDGRVDHTLYNRLLQKYVDDDGFVDYRGWKRQDEETLDAYLTAVGAVDPARLRDRAERIAFWVDVYNALTIKGILHFYPTKSIRDHVSVLGYNLWKDFTLSIHGKKYSLDHIEHGILRRMHEPRIHFAIVCASVGCPRLRNEAYTGARLEEQLTAGARAFFSDSNKFRIDPERRTVYLSPILKWFKKDFGDTRKARLGFVGRFIDREEDRGLLNEGNWRVRYLDYDWNLNDQARRWVADGGPWTADGGR